MRISFNALRDWGYSHFRILQPDPKKYSTIVGVGSIVPVQIEAYFLALNRYVDENAIILDVGFGLGYGLNILSIKSREVNGIDVDPEVLNYCTNTLVGKNPRLKILIIFDGYNLPFSDNAFDVVTCVDVIEHVEDYSRLIKEMLRVSRKGVFLSTPNRRPEFTNTDGSPKNYWHLREWSFEEFDEIIKKFGHVEWNFINGPYDGPFSISDEIKENTLALSPFIFK
jgi:ubiquinone/menaquinone biosynthesis C-methylase UbiE